MPLENTASMSRNPNRHVVTPKCGNTLYTVLHTLHTFNIAFSAIHYQGLQVNVLFFGDLSHKVVHLGFK
jgi:hypothetical protein